MGVVRLRVGDLDALRGFYERVDRARDARIGPRRSARLGAGDGCSSSSSRVPGAPPRPQRTTGLFHLAILVPDRARLGTALRRIAEPPNGGSPAPRTISSARPSTPAIRRATESRSTATARATSGGGERRAGRWTRSRSSSRPIEAEADGAGPMAAGTRMGHVHLNVADIPDSEAFYSGVLGFEPMVQLPTRSAVRRGRRLPPPPRPQHLGRRGCARHRSRAAWGSRASRSWCRTPAEVDAIATRLEDAGLGVERSDGGVKAADPSSNVVVVRASQAS